MDAAQTSQKFQAGVVTSTHGLKGELKIRPEQACAPALCAAREYQLRFSTESTTSVGVLRAGMHKQLILVALAGYDSVDSVRDFIGAEVWIDPDTLPEVTDGKYYWHQLKGLKVIDHVVGEVGTLEDLLTTPGHDIYVVQGPFGEVMIPVVAAMVERIDLSARVLYVSLPQGLVELN